MRGRPRGEGCGSTVAADRATDTSDHHRGGATLAGPDPTDTDAAGPRSDRRTATDRPHPAENRADDVASDPIGDGRACPSTGPGRRSRTPIARPSRVRGSSTDGPAADAPAAVGPGAGDDGTSVLTGSSPGSRCARPRASR